MLQDSRAIRAIDEILRRHPAAWAGVVTAIALAAAYLSTAAPGITWANDGGDGGDLVTAVVSSGVPHPSGYPTYLLIGRLFLAWPASDPAARLTLMSAIPMALAGGFLAALAASGSPGISWRAGVGLAAGLSFGLAPLPWSQAVIAEVHGLNALFAGLTLVLIARLSSSGPLGWPVTALAVICGLGLGNHLTFLLMTPPLAATMWSRWRVGERRRITIPAGGFVLGLAVYALLPLLASRHPPVNWGDASSGDGFWWLVSGGPYREMVFGLPLEEVPQRAAAWAGLLLRQFGPVGWFLVGAGLAFGRSRWPWVDRSTLWMAVAYSLFALGYEAGDSSAYLIPAYLGVAWWLALGVWAVLTRVERLRPGSAIFAVALLVLAWVARLPAIVQQVDARHDRRAVEYTAQVLHQAPPDALILTSRDHDSFPLWYAQYGLGRRPDLRLVVVSLGQFDWYRRGLAYTYPDLSFPPDDVGDAWAWEADLLARNARPVCRTEIVGEDDELAVRFHCRPAEIGASQPIGSAGS